MTTEEHARFTALEIRRPDEVRTAAGGPVPLSWQAERRSEHTDRLGNNALPDNFPYEVERGGAGDALAVLALGESIRRDIAYERAHRVREALTLGATWAQIAAALDIAPDHARELLRQWAAGQHHLHEGDVRASRDRPLGLDADRYTAVLALCELGDDESPAAAAR
ncbi:hypothetical protein [Streptomyces silvensis]|uniref:Uncharacterized protein n=1 Tax=Streptomyces silvensis TaxID=1765722 RepID=A0A0W7X3N7_9ACTN|nr:hypothetical protein [Streptomyces silvensis]KUF17367.1 hypothetical protein AT728_16325 [Streptomyces silvensis]